MRLFRKRLKKNLQKRSRASSKSFWKVKLQRVKRLNLWLRLKRFRKARLLLKWLRLKNHRLKPLKKQPRKKRRRIKMKSHHPAEAKGERVA